MNITALNNATLRTVNPFCVAIGVRTVREVASFIRSVSLREPLDKLEVRPGVIYQVATGVVVSIVTKIQARPTIALFMAGLSVDRVDLGAGNEVLLYVTTRAPGAIKLGGSEAQFELLADEPFEGAGAAIAEAPKAVPKPPVVVNIPPPAGARRPQMGAAKLSDAQMAEKFMQEGEDAPVTVVQAAYSPVATLSRHIDPLTGLETQVDPASRVKAAI